MDTSKIAHQVGQAQGQAQEKGSQLMEKTGNVVQSTKETMQQMVPQAKENYHAGKAQGQAEEQIQEQGIKESKILYLVRALLETSPIVEKAISRLRGEPLADL
ncbi:uncharacterized protein LOC132617700 isoform X3 [Lycium barbarum]|uniref:uncharacterized protein LOC132617700 isoform X3 n=1 Tax=Lycium barbarum TaxID=112863 RepID=UPI00293EFACD|nr:uncharacterized protein LOC132617700 isoform X3 [Lycium barbarum]